jgi:lipid-binding SYLF domain-containing protein
MKMTRMLRILPAAVILAALTAAFSLPVSADDAEKAAEKRAKIQANTKEALAELFKESPKAKELYGKAHGYAVFSNTKVSLGLTGGGGSGEAIEKATGKKTYMRMGTAGLNFGLGAQKYKVVFLFQDSVSFKNFVDKGWQAEAGANAVAGTAGANADPSFRQGMAVFTLTDGGLMLQADISGTKYWKSDDLN